MTEARGYVLGQSQRAARRLEIQDAHLAEPSERLLDELALRPQDRVVELGCGPSGFRLRLRLDQRLERWIVRYGGHGGFLGDGLRDAAPALRVAAALPTATKSGRAG